MKYCYFGLYKLHVFLPMNSHHISKHSCFLDIYHGSNMVFSPNKQKMLIKSCFDPAKHTVTYKRLTASVISIFTTAVVLKDGEPRSRAWTTTDHRQSFCLVMFCTIFIDLMYGLSLISPVEVLMSKMLSGSDFMMEYSIRLLGSSASSSTAWKQTRISSIS